MRLIDKKTSLSHDAACLQVYNAFKTQHPEHLELECQAGRGFIDVFARFDLPRELTHNGEKSRHQTFRYVIVEVKTERDDPSPGGWVRQLKAYKEKRHGDPWDKHELWLVHTFLLTEEQAAFMKAAGVKTFHIDCFSVGATPLDR